MCNLYKLKTGTAEIADLFRASAATNANAAGEVYPAYPGLVVRQEGDGRVLEAMTWGFPLVLAEARKRAEAAGKVAKPRPVNNARDDKLLTGMWRHWFETPAQRCLIPFDAFAEAEGEKGRMTRTWFTVKDQPVAAWAGLWRPTDVWGKCFTGVMVDATAEYFDIHDRMPVILPADAHDAWLNAPAGEAMALVRQYPADRLGVERTVELWARR